MRILDPRHSEGNLLALQRFGEARETIQSALARKPDSDANHLDLYVFAFLARDTNAMAEQSVWLKSQSEYESMGFSLEADTAAYAGELRKARELTRRAVDSALRTGNKEAAADWSSNAALREAAFGNAAEARRAGAEALKLDPTDQGAEIEGALALAIAGDTARAEPLVQDLGKRFPLDIQVQSV